MIKKQSMVAVLVEQRSFSDYFIGQMLSRNLRIEQQVIDRLFNATEKHLARTLLLLARYGRLEHSKTVLPNVAPSTLSQVLKTTPSQIDRFMQKFKAFGFVQDTDARNAVQVETALLSIALRD